MNRTAFFAGVRSRASGVFGTSLSQGQVDGIEAILDEAERRRTPLRHLAYILATAYHESAHTMQAVRETLAKTDDGAIAALEKAWRASKLPWVKTPYWRKDADGKAWFGRGLVQLTHKANYQKMALILGVDLVGDPSKALELSTAVRILFEGMVLGSFTGRALADYIDDGKADYVGARRIVNGTDKAELIAGYASAFETALIAADYGKPAQTSPQPVIVEKPVVADPGELGTPAGKSKTVRTWALAGLGAIVTAAGDFMGGLDWRVQLFISASTIAFAAYGIKRRFDLAKAVRDLKAEFST